MNEKKIIFGRHPVMEALKSDTPMEKIYFKKGIQGAFFPKMKRLAARAGIPISPADDRTLDSLSEKGNHQGILAIIAYREYNTVDEIIDSAWAEHENPFIVVLNEVQDPQNFGSLIRTALGAGVHGIIIPNRRSAQLSATVSKVAAGADAYMQIAKVTNVADTLEELKGRGIFCVGAEADADKSYIDYSFTGPLALVLGGESKGLGQRVRNTCDDLVKIPLKGEVNSLNVGVAGAVLMFKAAENR